MQLSVCTISFRHQLVSIDHIARWARRSGFDGIELWGIHARGLASQPQYDAQWLKAMGLEISMLSDYLPIVGDRVVARQKCDLMYAMAKHWETPKLRTFAGQVASQLVSRPERLAMTHRLREICQAAQGHGLEVLVETHPNTLADTPASVLQLLEEVDHPALKLNFDTLHVWEAGVDPTCFHRQVAAYVAHYHLKNIQSREQLTAFAPENVYSPAGTRQGMVSLFEGALDYQVFLKTLMGDSTKSASLEWFGHDVRETLLKDKALLDDLRCRVYPPEMVC
ncbi:sugar phosphate isomerase/epimerase family protein [Photobacterium aphoticum]|uniref:3-dehydroshikimate dehydratase n=1 Tax=Photobacterium aphoticum TaxID=754436 RepID=A0A0J1JCG9_9GAMM|nr:sugar phosphate isomerase/epimerase family protein [Photobacterium aphoticum]KLU99286.1 3-dehydroshikimate dehydratase [Photobacterium aphoticum]PSU55308.1 sugar phosphate isomerase/epimerase [Photobacterium aphoticum]GHA46266.1 3-dehydroshikimate dehydratase [Photobacterium aphoticum]